MQDPRTESVLNSLKVKFKYVPEFPMKELVFDPRTQVRREDNRAPRPEVDRYFHLLKSGAEFPPIIVMSDGRVIDGNTRTGAYEKMRRTTIPAYTVDTTSLAVAKLVGVEMNVVHGRRMEKAELAEWLASGNGSVTAEDAQRLTGWSGRTVQRVREALRFNDRAKKLGLELATVLPEAVREALMKVTNAECFRALTLLAEKSGMTAKEINEAAREINDLSLTNQRAALDKIAEMEHDRRQQIEERAAGLRVTTTMYRQIALHLGWVIKQGPAELHDVSPYTSTKSQRYLEDALDVIREALTRY